MIPNEDEFLDKTHARNLAENFIYADSRIQVTYETVLDSVKCPVCEVNFSQTQMMERHLRWQHPLVIEQMFGQWVSLQSRPLGEIFDLSKNEPSEDSVEVKVPRPEEVVPEAAYSRNW